MLRFALCAVATWFAVEMFAAEMFAAETSFAASGSSTLQWGRPQVTSKPTSPIVTSPETIDHCAANEPTPETFAVDEEGVSGVGTGPIRSAEINKSRSTPPRQHTRIRRDSNFMAAVWDVDDANPLRQTSGADHSVVVERVTPSYDYDPPAYDPPAYDPFDEDDRLAQLPDDPFDEPAEESIPVPESEDDMGSVEDALEQEIKRRQSADDLFDEKMEDALESDSQENDPLDELNETDSLDEDDDLDGDFDDTLENDLDLDKLQSDREEMKTPDLDLDFDREDAQGEDALTAEELEEQRKELEIEQRKSEEICRKELADLQADRISSIDLGIRVDGNAGEDFPFECAVSSSSHQPRQWPQITYTWKAAALCHKPLYFEQVQLERYGHSWGPYVQPIMSGVHFFGTLPVMPYKMGIRTPCECVYTLGYYRPGSCAPYMIEPIPFTWRAAMFQGAAVTGTAFVIP